MVNLTQDEIIDTINLLNRTNLTGGNTIGEAKTLLNIINKLELALKSNNKNDKSE